MLAPNLIRFQYRFVKPRYCYPKHWTVVSDSATVAKWKQYYVDQRFRATLDPVLTLNQRKEVREACDAFEWTPERTVLVRERIE